MLVVSPAAWIERRAPDDQTVKETTTRRALVRSAADQCVN